MTPAEFHDAALDRTAACWSTSTSRSAAAGRAAGGRQRAGRGCARHGQDAHGALPGRAARALGRLATCERFQRIQFTPDLMPSDILGTSVFHLQTATFTFRRGPIFANVVVADEVNRAPAKTQSALLEAMEEHQVTVEGQRMPLPPVFLVVATQNPVEFEGTYPLPEAQLDRFLFKVLVDYGSAEAERGSRPAPPRRAAGHRPGCRGTRRPWLTCGRCWTCAARSPASRSTTRWPSTWWRSVAPRAACPRCSTAPACAARSACCTPAKRSPRSRGRDYVTPDDVKVVAAPVLRHRMLLKPEAELDGLRPDDVIQRILSSVAVPR